MTGERLGRDCGVTGERLGRQALWSDRREAGEGLGRGWRGSVE